MSTTIAGPDGQPRCRWCVVAPEYLHYHDTEWGFPVDDDRRLFEKLCLEGFQSGLSWRTILNNETTSAPRSTASTSIASRASGRATSLA